MSNQGYIVVPSFLRMKPERHTHRCPICHKMVEENNTVCQKELGPMGLGYHTFPCMPHIADWRTRFGIDDLLDVYLEPEQARRFVHEWTDAKVAEREAREATVNPELRSVKQEPTPDAKVGDAFGIVVDETPTLAEKYGIDHPSR